jgi:aromatic-L-amino-acid decarboxylase
VPEYLVTREQDDVTNLMDYGVQLGRRFRALKLWTVIRANGVSGLQARLRRDLANAQWLAAEVRQTPDWRVLTPVPLQTVCIRHQPPGLDGEALDRHTRAWCDRVNRSGAAYLTPAVLDGRWMVRVSIGALPTERHHVEALWAAIRAAAGDGASAASAQPVHV